jgi:hypothetical protein
MPLMASRGPSAGNRRTAAIRPGLGSPQPANRTDLIKIDALAATKIYRGVRRNGQVTTPEQPDRPESGLGKDNI